MTAVFVALGRRLNSQHLLDDVGRVAAAGQDVHLISWVAPSPELARAVGEVVVLRGRAAPVRPTSTVADPQESPVALAAAEAALSAGDLRTSAQLEESVSPPAPTRAGGSSSALLSARRFLRRPARRVKRRARRMVAGFHRPLAAAVLGSDARARALVDRADVMVAEDWAAVPAVWWAARRNERALCVVGAAAAVARLTTGVPSPPESAGRPG
jgi:hypothetical protein